ncbi:major facilitator superfamily domain-containing protein [Aspergillus caelatus]|uniref:Major facilitator superfamily domain-containing protein n=1 Tax=Aspergillus caelatus TaxID=61420 RepID=A0A5N7ANQ8_9EURO|nr:major facilitator superfamily domain-containing protein [Aspergillus caelatus]KAE8370360.1 major facilitator superfamily domain-containing protein [Aspergillus caelatus]
MRQPNAARPGNDNPTILGTGFVDHKEPLTTISRTQDKPPTTSDKSISSSNKPRWFHWHEPGTSRADKKLIFKLDWFLLSFSCLYFFIKQLDGNNISNAYVSDMKEELGFGPGNELSWMNTYFNIGQIVGGPLSNLALTVIRPRFWLPGCLVAWSLFVLFLFKCNTASEFYGLRFCIGFFESAAWPGVQYVLGCWYRKSEMARRSSLFVMSGVLGQMFSGYLQAALFSGMEGKGGMSSWRWLFIFDFLLAVPVAIYGIIFYPDTPENTTAFYLSESERERARARIQEEGRTPVGYAFWTLTCGSYVMQYFSIWLKSLNIYSVPQINNIPTALGAVNFFFMLTSGFVADNIGRRGPVCFAVGCLLTFCFAVFTAWPASRHLKMAAFILSGCYGCYTPLLAGWVNSSCGGDQQLRAFTLAFMVSLGQAVVIPFQQLQFPSGEAPSFTRTHGWVSGLCFVIILTLWTGFGIEFVEWLVGRKGKGKRVIADEPDVDF